MYPKDLFPHKEIQELLELYRPIWALGYAQQLMGWDLETYMPEEGSLARSLATQEITLLMQKLMTDEKFIKALEKAERVEDLNEYERGVVRVLKRDLRFFIKVPPEVVGELSRVTSEATVVWRNAKKSNDFNAFKPYLEKIVDLNIKVAGYLGYDKNPYDALLDLYEEGLTTDDFQRVIDVLIPGLKKVLDKILSEGYYSKPHPLEEYKYDIEKMKYVNSEILRILGQDPRRLRLDISAHPFTSGLDMRDVRITTRYEGYDFKRTIFSVIHEFGHALYDLQIDERFRATPLSGGASLGVHESQSRFWENIIGRSKEFTEVIYDLLADNLGLRGKYDVNEIYRYFNVVRPGLIRVDADEVTYNFHIALRFELEKLLINKEIKVDDLPELWNNYMDKYLGVRPKTYSEGVLQDIHWSMGSIGYFPTYTIGTLLAAQIREKMRQEIDLSEAIRKRNFGFIREWLREKIHRHGSVYPPKELIKRALGEDLRPEIFVNYLQWKFLET